MQEDAGEQNHVTARAMFEAPAPHHVALLSLSISAIPYKRGKQQHAKDYIQLPPINHRNCFLVKQYTLLLNPPRCTYRLAG